MTEKKKLSMWLRYSTLGASSRLRFLQYMPFLSRRGWEIDVHSFFTDAYLEKLYRQNRRSLTEFTGSWCRQFRELYARRREKVPYFIEYDLLPYTPYAIEKALLGRHPYVLNFDDAVDGRYAGKPGLQRKFPRLITGAAGVVAANTELFSRFSRWQNNLIKLPTVPPPVMPVETEKFPELTLVWIGTPVTYHFLQERAEALRAAAAVTPFRLLVIAGKNLPPLPGIAMECVDWSQEKEISLLPKAHIGLMPLPDTEFARGKSAYKLIQYLHCGLPAIASPIGENRQVLQEGKTGFFFQTDQDFAAAVKRLSYEEERKKMQSSIAAAAAEYSHRQIGKKLDNFLTATFYPEQYDV